MFRFLTWVHGVTMGFALFLGFYFGTAYAMNWKKSIGHSRAAILAQNVSPQNQANSPAAAASETDTITQTQSQGVHTGSDQSQQNNNNGFSQRQARDELTDHR